MPQQELAELGVVEATTAISLTSCGLSTQSFARLQRVYTELKSLSLCEITNTHVSSFDVFTWCSQYATELCCESKTALFQDEAHSFCSAPNK